ncbi:hypothetical protein ACHHYP_00225 [Achlya hypogyna]|uniref:Uncharacterized protein n=1 Tax=Achlya hypogyna TaxID=1202772 RepID=A0A1V9ZBG2_ACHHY|nr:hypothetical protein ACHHYP_00225 [Achlya hypogyna]
MTGLAVADDATATYWAKHAALKAAHHDDVVQVFGAFHKTLQHWHGTDEQRAKLERLLTFVEYCLSILDENQQDHPARASEDLGRVHKYIQGIVLPYLSKLHVEEVSFGRKASSASYVSLTTTSSTADGTLQAHDMYTETSTIDDTEVYWQHHAALKLKFADDVTTVAVALRRHLDGAPPTAKLREIERCEAVLGEDRATHAPRSLDDLDVVWQCIDRVVLPYMTVLATPPVAPAPTDDNSSLTPYWREQTMLRATYADDVAAVERAYETFVTHMQDPAHEAKKDRVRKMLVKVRFVRGILEERPDTHNDRSMEELEQVYAYVLKYVAPYLNKAAAKEALAKQI